MISKEKLIERYEEELSDAEEYTNLANECDEYKQIFHCISGEESTHAELIKYIMDHVYND